MSVVVSNSNQICNSPLNLSRSKQLYSIPRDQRFKSEIKPPCMQAFYDLPSQQDQRKTALGYGTKYDFTKDNQKVPGPNNYNIKRDFDPAQTKGPSIGLGRDMMQQGGTFPLKKGPGPGAYERHSGLSKTSYSMRAKTVNPMSFTTSSKNPGPGTYNIEATVNDKGRYTLSRFRNSGANIIAPSSSKRFGPRPYETDAPGPGQYQPKNDLEQGGKYVLSKYESNVGKTMPHCYRKDPIMTFHTTPGPGSYKLPSEFGHYEDKHAHQKH